MLQHPLTFDYESDLEKKFFERAPSLIASVSLTVFEYPPSYLGACLPPKNPAQIQNPRKASSRCHLPRNSFEGHYAVNVT